MTSTRKPTAYESLLAGSVSGMAAVVVCHPLDVIRTKIQLNHNLTLSQAVQLSWSEGGIKGLYKGFVMPFVAQVMYKSIIFATNTVSQNYLFQGSTSYSSMFLSGTIAGSVNAIVVSPVEVIRTTQIQSNAGQSGISSKSQLPLSQTIKHIYTQRGFGGFWISLLPAIVRDGPGIGFYLLAFDKSKQSLLKWSNSSSSSEPPKTCPIWIRLVSGSLAGIAFWTWGMPIDTIKTIIESNLKSSQANISIFSILKGVKVWDLYRALPVAYIRGIPSAAVTLTAYDICLDYLIRD